MDKYVFKTVFCNKCKNQENCPYDGQRIKKDEDSCDKFENKEERHNHVWG